MEFTVVDAVVAVVVLLSGVLAYSRGLMREALAILGWVAAAVVAFIFAPQAEPLIKQVPVVGEFIADSCEISMIAAFFAVGAVALIVVSIFAPLFSSVIQRSAVGGVDQGLGFLFGIARGILLVAVAFFVYSSFVTADPIAVIDDSQSAIIFDQLTQRIVEQNPEQALGWLKGRYEELVSACTVSQQ